MYGSIAPIILLNIPIIKNIIKLQNTTTIQLIKSIHKNKQNIINFLNNVPIQTKKYYAIRLDLIHFLKSNILDFLQIISNDIPSENCVIFLIYAIHNLCRISMS